MRIKRIKLTYIQVKTNNEICDSNIKDVQYKHNTITNSDLNIVIKLLNSGP